MVNNPYAQYQNSKILTASPAELTLMLYDGAIKFGNIAIMAMKENDIQKAHNNIIKVQRIIEEFRQTLDMKYPVAEDFKRMYDYIFALLTEANMNKDMELLNRALGELRDMRDIWKEVMKRARGPQLTLS